MLKERTKEAIVDQIDTLHRARRRVEALVGLYIHAAVYVIVNFGLFLINLATLPEWWVQWPLAGWGIGLIAHGAVVFAVLHPRVIAWEEQKVREMRANLDAAKRIATNEGDVGRQPTSALEPAQTRFRFF